MSLYRTVFILVVILTPIYALTSVHAQEKTTNVDIAVGSGNSDNSKFYVPERITVEVGSTVEWTNLDEAMHTVTDGTPTGKEWGSIFDSGIMREDDVYTFTFNEAGQFPYLCALHPWMLGKVTVLPEGGSAQVEVSFTTDRTKYPLGDSVSVRGNISPVSGDEPAVIEVLNPTQARFLTESVAVKEDGAFSHDFKLEGDLVVLGSYTVRVTYSGVSTESTFLVEKPSMKNGSELGTGSADLRVAAKQLRDFFIIRVRNSVDSGASVYGISFEVSDQKIEAFRGPRDWSKPATTLSSEVRSSTLGDAVEPGGKVYFKLKVEGDEMNVGLIHWLAYGSSDSIVDQGDTKPIRRG